MAALTTRPLKDLGLRLTKLTCRVLVSLIDEGLRPSNKGKLLAEIEDAVS